MVSAATAIQPAVNPSSDATRGISQTRYWALKTLFRTMIAPTVTSAARPSAILPPATWKRTPA